MGAPIIILIQLLSHKHATWLLVTTYIAILLIYSFNMAFMCGDCYVASFLKYDTYILLTYMTTSTIR